MRAFLLTLVLGLHLLQSLDNKTIRRRNFCAIPNGQSPARQTLTRNREQSQSLSGKLKLSLAVLLPQLASLRFYTSRHFAKPKHINVCN